MRRPPPITITETPGNQFADLPAAQRAGLSRLADSLGDVIRDLLECGVLVIRDGKIIPNPERQKRDE